MLLDSNAKALIVHADLWPAIASSVPEGVAVVFVPADPAADAELPDGALWWHDWLARNEPWAQPPQTAPTSIIYTSGTTGRPKGVVRRPPSDAQREAVRALFGEIFQLAAGERTVIPAPMYHSAPNAYTHAATIHGMDMTIMAGFDGEEFLRILAEASHHGRADGPDDVRAPAGPAGGGARSL